VLVARSRVGAAAFALSFRSMLPASVKFGEWKAGVRAEDATYGLIILAQIVALGIGVGLLGALLDLVGYRAIVMQNPATLKMPQALLTLPTALYGQSSIGCVAIYPLDARTRARLVRFIAQRARHMHPL
jgi:GPH family glycoside/pentoside/hexuronide:cation symporter